MRRLRFPFFGAGYSTLRMSVVLLGCMAFGGWGHAAEPVQRLMIQYKDDSTVSARAAKAADPDLSAAAARQVARTASRVGTGRLRYLKSVSAGVHVAALDQALPEAEAKLLMERMREDPAVAAVVIDRRVRPHAVSDPYFTNSRQPLYQWHLQSSASMPGGINAAPAWDISDGTNVVVAVVDGGYRPHADLVANLLPGHDFITADSAEALWTANDGNGRDNDATDPGDWVETVNAYGCDPEDSSWHGTHVAGLVAAQANGREGVGVAHGARVLPVRVLGRCGGYASDVLAGARWAAGLSTGDPGVPANPHPRQGFESQPRGRQPLRQHHPVRVRRDTCAGGQRGGLLGQRGGQYPDLARQLQGGVGGHGARCRWPAFFFRQRGPRGRGQCALRCHRFHAEHRPSRACGRQLGGLLGDQHGGAPGGGCPGAHGVGSPGSAHGQP